MTKRPTDPGAARKGSIGSRWTWMRGFSDSRHRRGAFEAHQVDVAPASASETAWYCMRGLRPRSPSTITAVRIVTVYLLLGLSSAALALFITPLVARGSIRARTCRRPGRPEGSCPIGAPPRRPRGPRRHRARDDTRPPSARTAPRNLDVAAPFRSPGGLVFVVGLLDDVRGLGPGPKLAARASPPIVVMASGLLIERVTLLGASWDSVGGVASHRRVDRRPDQRLQPDRRHRRAGAGIAVIAGATCGAILIVRGHTAEAMLLAALVGAAARLPGLQLRTRVDLPR